MLSLVGAWFSVHVTEGQQKKSEVNCAKNVHKALASAPFSTEAGAASEPSVCLIKTMLYKLFQLSCFSQPFLFSLDQRGTFSNHSHIVALFGCVICLCDTKVTGPSSEVFSGTSSVLSQIKISSCFSFTVYIFASSEIIKSSPETCKMIHHVESSFQNDSFVVVLGPRQNHSCCSDVWWMGSRPGSSWRWRIAALAFYVFALPSQICFIRELPRMLFSSSSACFWE